MRRDRAASFFLLVALLCFGFDLVHFSHHLRHDPTLLDLPGVGGKLVWKGGLFVGALLLFIFAQPRPLLLWVLFLTLSEAPPPLFAAMTYASCERVRGFMKESGIARDAKEDFFGRLKIKPPRASFPPEMDRVTWWGTFKPFEFWESPQFEATWINPQGEPVGEVPFRGGRCQLAKATLQVDQLPQRRLEPGMWRVIVRCEDVVIDNHPFIVSGSPSLPVSDTEEGAAKMIWVDELNHG